LAKSFLYLDWAGEVANTKKKQPRYFNENEPVFTMVVVLETVVGFSSQETKGGY
jgi:hypothetical protein